MPNLDSFTRGVMAGSLLMIFLGLVMTLLFFGLWLYGFVHCLKNRHDKDRLVWVLVTLFGGPIGAFIYITIGQTVTQQVPPVMLSTNNETPLKLEPIPDQYFDPAAMHDDKLRAQLIADAVWKDAKSNRASGR